jgi:hypothetical protein
MQQEREKRMERFDHRMTQDYKILNSSSIFATKRSGVYSVVTCATRHLNVLMCSETVNIRELSRDFTPLNLKFTIPGSLKNLRILCKVIYLNPKARVSEFIAT